MANLLSTSITGTLSTTGNTGIGTTAPSGKFHVATGLEANNVYITTSSNAGTGYDVNLYLNGGANNSEMTINMGIVGNADRDRIRTYQGNMYFRTNDSENMIINSSGNVGIGTTSPGSKLDVISSSTQIADFRSTVTDGLSNIRIVNDQQTTASGTSPAAIELVGKRGSSSHGRHAWIGAEGVDGTTFRTQIKFKVRPEDSPYQWSTLPTQMVIDGNGNVGIGTTAPISKLHIDSALGADVISISDNAGSVRLALGQESSYTGNYIDSKNIDLKLKSYLSGGSGGNIFFQTGTSAASTQVTINVSGNVGIGTTSPGTKLDVAGNARFGGTDTYNSITINNNSNTGGGGILLQRNGVNNAYLGALGWYQGTSNSGAVIGTDNSSYPIVFYTNVEQMRITGGGNVGIGTTSPGSKLSISGSNSGSVPLVDLAASGSGAFQRGVRMLNSGMVAGDSIMYSAGQKDSSKNMGQFYFHYAGDGSNSNRISMGLHSVDDVFNITGAGNVGIGTTSPAYKLDVSSDIRIGEGLTMSPNEGSLYSVNGALSYYSSTNGVYLNGAGTNGWLRLNASGVENNNNSINIYGAAAGGYIELRTGGSTRIHIQNGGNVGIGTTSPSDKLDVSGNARTSGYVLVNNHSDNTLGYRILNTNNFAVSAMFTNSSNQLVIAAGAVDQINLNKKVLVNAVALGVNVAPSATAGRIDASNDIVAFSSSDERLKHNITPIENALDKVKSLTGVEFDWKPEHKEAHGHEGRDTGIIAQQVLAVMPTAVRTNDTGYLAVRYEKLIGLLIEANKELAARVEELEKKIG
jgi:hypothetical protein